MKRLLLYGFSLSFLLSQDRDLLGDLNQDGTVDILDIIRTVNIVLEVPPEPTEYELWASDMNEDCETDVQDIILMIDLIIHLPQWYSLGMEDKVIRDLALYPPFLFACTGPDGLWSLNTEIDNSDWEYVGMSLEDAGCTEGGGVSHMVTDIDDPGKMLVIFNGNDASSVYNKLYFSQ